MQLLLDFPRLLQRKWLRLFHGDETGSLLLIPAGMASIKVQIGHGPLRCQGTAGCFESHLDAHRFHSALQHGRDKPTGEAIARTGNVDNVVQLATRIETHLRFVASSSLIVSPRVEKGRMFTRSTHNCHAVVAQGDNYVVHVVDDKRSQASHFPQQVVQFAEVFHQGVGDGFLAAEISGHFPQLVQIGGDEAYDLKGIMGGVEGLGGESHVRWLEENCGEIGKGKTKNAIH